MYLVKFRIWDYTQWSFSQKNIFLLIFEIQAIEIRTKSHKTASLRNIET